MKLRYTRAMLEAALSGKLDNVEYSRDPVFGLEIPHECPDVPKEILVPRNTWKDGKAYDQKARDLAGRFRKNFAQFEEGVAAEVRNAGPTA
jgi:phosphoenolpyruvate carboxykinase (ATP)